MKNYNKGWYYHWEWAAETEPWYYDGIGSSPLDKGPFKTEKEAYEDQYGNHMHDVMESKMAAKWCKDKMKRLKK
jgi:hypothetical protein